MYTYPYPYPYPYPYTVGFGNTYLGFGNRNRAIFPIFIPLASWRWSCLSAEPGGTRLCSLDARRGRGRDFGCARATPQGRLRDRRYQAAAAHAPRDACTHGGGDPRTPARVATGARGGRRLQTSVCCSGPTPTNAWYKSDDALSNALLDMRRLVPRPASRCQSTEHCHSLTPSWQSQAGVPGYMLLLGCSKSSRPVTGVTFITNLLTTPAGVPGTRGAPLCRCVEHAPFCRVLCFFSINYLRSERYQAALQAHPPRHRPCRPRLPPPAPQGARAPQLPLPLPQPPARGAPPPPPRRPRRPPQDQPAGVFESVGQPKWCGHCGGTRGEQ